MWPLGQDQDDCAEVLAVLGERVGAARARVLGRRVDPRESCGHGVLRVRGGVPAGPGTGTASGARTRPPALPGPSWAAEALALLGACVSPEPTPLVEGKPPLAVVRQHSMRQGSGLGPADGHPRVCNTGVQTPLGSVNALCHETRVVSGL